MPDDSPPASGGVPTPGPGNLWDTPRTKRNIDQTLASYRQGLGFLDQTAQENSRTIPPMSAGISGLMRDWLAHAVGQLRFGANVYGFEFTPSISIIAKDLLNLEMSLKNFRVPLERSVREVLIPSIEENFASGGRPPWEPLSQETVDKHRAKLGMGDKPILVRSSLMMKWATSFQIWTINATSAVIKELPSIVWYANVHQNGIENGSTRREGTPGWFKVYQIRAQHALGASVTSQKKIDAMAWKIFDEHVMAGGLKGTDTGAGKGKGNLNIPARRFIAWQEEDFAKVQMIFYEWMDEMIVERGHWVGRGGL